MTNRQETALWLLGAIIVGVHLMLERLRNLIRDVFDANPLTALSVVSAGWLLIGVTVAL